MSVSATEVEISGSEDEEKLILRERAVKISIVKFYTLKINIYRLDILSNP